MSTIAKRDSTGERGSLRFSKVNVITLLAGVAAVAAGYGLLAGGSTVAAPLLLVLGYVVLIPLGIVR
jgi:hypothetical protein